MDFQKDRIIEINITKMAPDGSTKGGSKFIDPEIEIPASTTALNGITNEKVKGQPNFKTSAQKLVDFLGDCDLAGFNLTNFDLKFLLEEFGRAGIPFNITDKKILDLSKVYNAMEPRDLPAAYQFYCNKPIEKFRNTSQKEIEVFMEIAAVMMNKYNGKEFKDKNDKTHKFENSMDSIHNNFISGGRKSMDNEGFIVLNGQGRPVFSKGKFMNKLVSESCITDPGYYDWVMNKSLFPADTKILVQKIVEKAKKAQLVVAK